MADEPLTASAAVLPLVPQGIGPSPDHVTGPAIGPEWAEQRGIERGMTSEGRTLFGQKLKAARMKKGLTQADLSRLTGIAQPDISLIERGGANVTIETMEKLAGAVSVPLHLLLKP